MKQMKKYIIVIVLFVILMIIVLFFFLNKYSNIHLLNKSREMINDIKDLKEGHYVFKNGVILSENETVINKKYYYDGNGNIYIDKYGNIKFLINDGKTCISKTSQGDIKLNKGECRKFKEVTVQYSKNNSKISFTSKTKNLLYKVSNEDDFKGNWYKEEYTDNLILSYFREGKNYIWFKDEEGNISDAYEFSVDCLNTRKASYDKNIFYCSGSTVMLDNIEWIVIEDNNRSIKLMKVLPVDVKLEQCKKEKSEYCFYTKTESLKYNWNNSYLNYYLNNIFINKLSQETKDSILDSKICNDFSRTCSGEVCGGHIKEEIEYNNFICDEYVDSKVRVITYDEFNYIYSKNNNRDLIDGNYWALNSYEIGKGSSIQRNYEFYILEDFTSKLDAKPVIVLKK